MESNNTQAKQIDLNNMNKKQAVFVIWQLLNKAQSRGVFSIDEACAAKAAINKIDSDNTINSTNEINKDI